MKKPKIYSLFNFCQTVKNTVQSQEFLEKAKKVETAFTRKRKMPFCDIIYFMVSAAKKSLQHELEIYFENKRSKSVSRQAFAKARENIKPEVFRNLNDLVVDKFEKEDGAIETYKGYRLLSVDGTIIDLPCNEDLKARFGYSSNGTDKYYCKALGMTAFDLLNKLTIFAEIYRYDDSEKRRILDIVDGFNEIEYYKKSIWILDRGYPSFELFDKIENNKQNYVIRVSSNSLKEINEAESEDQTVNITRSKKTIKVRVVKITFENGLTEKLVTNLSDDFTMQELKKLYAKRWNIETNYNFIKNKEMLECFTGATITSVLQDFYISILLINASAIAYREQEDIIRKNQKIKKYTYNPNKTILISDIKKNWIAFLLAKSPLSRVYKQLYLYSRIKQYAYAIVPDKIHPPRTLTSGHTRRKSHLKSPL